MLFWGNIGWSLEVNSEGYISEDRALVALSWFYLDGITIFRYVNRSISVVLPGWLTFTNNMEDCLLIYQGFDNETRSCRRYITIVELLVLSMSCNISPQSSWGYPINMHLFFVTILSLTVIIIGIM